MKVMQETRRRIIELLRIQGGQTVRDLTASLRLTRTGVINHLAALQAAADKFATLFVGHYAAVKGYMAAAFANNFKGNPALKKAAVDRLVKNADDIAVFVSSANPNLPKATVYGLLLTHGQQHLMAIDAAAKKDWAGEADMWDPMVKHIYTISDALAGGIAKQFPDKFQ